MGRVNRCKRQAPQWAERKLTRAEPETAKRIPAARREVKAEQAREKISERFKHMAKLREMRAYGFRDGSKRWQAMNDVPKNRIEAYNRASKIKQRQMLRDPEAARTFEKIMDKHERSCSQGRGR